MNVTEIQQNYTNYQNNNSNSKTQSNEEFLSALQNFESYKTEETTKIKPEEEYDEKYQLGLQRYNAFQSGDNKWFEDSIFEKDRNAKNEFINYLSNLPVNEYMLISLNFKSSFGGQLMEDENGNIVPEKYEKNSAKEFSSIKSSINYFDKEINDLIEGARKFGGDPSYMINFLTDIQNFFKNYQSKEQENQYQILGNQN
jgi:hypothetical protein